MSFTFYDIYKALKKLLDFYFPVIVGEIKKYFLRCSDKGSAESCNSARM